jgi:hypothetical protein
MRRALIVALLSFAAWRANDYRRELRSLSDAKLRRLHSCAVWWSEHPPAEGWGLPRLPTWSRWMWRVRDRPLLDQIDALGAELRRRGLDPIAPHREGEPEAAPPTPASA